MEKKMYEFYKKNIKKVTQRKKEKTMEDEQNSNKRKGDGDESKERKRRYRRGEPDHPPPAQNDINDPPNIKSVIVVSNCF